MINSLHSSRNGLLKRLSENERERLEPYCETVFLQPNQALAVPGGRLKELWFPESGFVSIIVGEPPECGVEVGLIGREGMIGYVTALGLTHSLHHAVVQQEGAAHRLDIQDFRRLSAEIPSLQRLVARFVAVMLIQVSDTASSNARGRVVERLARWLLMAHDRSDGDTLHLVHRYLAEVLAVRRAGVTDALHTLEGEGLIRAERGRITVRDREGLAAVARASYGFAERAYARIMDGTGSPV